MGVLTADTMTTSLILLLLPLLFTRALFGENCHFEETGLEATATPKTPAAEGSR